MEVGSAPALVSSRCRIIYRRSSWSVHQFEVWSGDIVCRVAALRGAGWLLVWVGGAEPQLSEMALGVPARSPGADGAAATALVGGDGAAAALARRLAARLSRPVYVCLGSTFDRFTAPIVEKGLIFEIKSRPECF